MLRENGTDTEPESATGTADQSQASLGPRAGGPSRRGNGTAIQGLAENELHRDNDHEDAPKSHKRDSHQRSGHVYQKHGRGSDKRTASGAVTLADIGCWFLWFLLGCIMRQTTEPVASVMQDKRIDYQATHLLLFQKAPGQDGRGVVVAVYVGLQLSSPTAYGLEFACRTACSSRNGMGFTWGWKLNLGDLWR
ncbi:hypothetical protein OE88DRAFT_1643699 [Heliocybe sulcata]|uniref:Uncharacterized protein n=1 Tax=Heliocybe sulcata TaxID=5364 RepID=A0A5C3N941_9AGAM|nr:hypothetical protein OE88DRAFT_1643699 [Heliocybe sulcata]